MPQFGFEVNQELLFLHIISHEVTHTIQSSFDIYKKKQNKSNGKYIENKSEANMLEWKERNSEKAAENQAYAILLEFINQYLNQ